jgi:hypothetical protein
MGTICILERVKGIYKYMQFREDADETLRMKLTLSTSSSVHVVLVFSQL